MSTLHELRTTLEQHAESLHDAERVDRAAAVRQRVRVVRRRRTATVVLAAVVAMVAVAGLVGALRTPHDVQPVDRLLDVRVPGEIDVLDFPYVLDDLQELTDEPRLRLGGSDNDRAVLLVATGLGPGTATLYADGEAVARVRADDPLAAPVTLGDAEADLRVRLDGTDDTARAGVAVYEATGELPPGVSNGTAVFRDEVAGDRLLDAGFLEPGESAIVLQTQGALRDLRFTFYCVAPDDVWVTVAIEDNEAAGTGCRNHPGLDAGAGTSVVIDQQPAPPDDSAVRVYLTQGALGPQLTSPDDMVLGAAVYERSVADQQVLGDRVDSRVEYASRTWVLDEVAGGSTTVDTAEGDVLLGLVTDGAGQRVSWVGDLDRGGSAAMTTNAGGTNSLLAGVLFAGDRYDVRTTGGEARLLLYRPEVNGTE